MVFQNKQKNKNADHSVLDLLEIEKKEEQYLYDTLPAEATEKLGFIVNNVQPTNQADFENDFQNLLDNSYINEVEGELSLDVYEDDNKIMVQAPLAGVSLDDIDINYSQGVLTIKGERKAGNEVKNDKYYIKECFWGKFSRSILLPNDIDTSAIAAHLKNGILTIVLPKLDLPNNVSVSIKKI
jgi:HSP20 family protein